MSIISPKSVRDFIIIRLINGPRDTLSVLDELQKEHHITKQAFYSALRQLQKEEAIVKYKEHISLDTTWIFKLQKIIALMETSYTVSEKSGLLHFLSLKDGESATYKFQSITHLDQFWGNIQNLALTHTNKNDHLYVYDPHYWFFLARDNTEAQLLKNIQERERLFLMSVNGASHLDAYIKKQVSNNFIRINNNQKLFEKPNYYVTVISDYILEITIDIHIANKVTELFHLYSKPCDELSTELGRLLTKRSKNKFKISRNKKKADLLRKKLGKNFLIK